MDADAAVKAGDAHRAHARNCFRPKKLIGDKKAPDGREFTWGVIVRIHELGVYQIVEFKQDNSTLTDPQSWAEHGRICFHPYLDRKDTSHSFDTLEEAIIGVIAYAKQGPNSQAGFFASKILGLYDAIQ